MWAYNNADAEVRLFLIRIMKMDMTEWSLWTKHKACLDSFPRHQYSLHCCCDILFWAVWITNVLSDKCPYEEQHWLMWTPLFNVLVSVSGHCTVSSSICLNRPTGSVIPHWHSCTSIWLYTLCFSALSWVPLCPKYADRILYLTFNSQHRQIVHHLPPAATTTIMDLLSQSFSSMMSSGNYAAYKVKAVWRWNTSARGTC